MIPAPSILPEDIRDKYETYEWRHACAVLKTDFPREWEEILTVLRAFTFSKADVVAGGGRKSKIASSLDGAFTMLGWREKQFQTQIVVDGAHHDSPTHKIDCFKNGVALEIEWNNKDPFFDRDLNNFRLLFDLRTVSVGVIVTRCDSLESLFASILATAERRDKKNKYGASTTHMSKLLPKIEGGGGAGCPLLVFGISKECYIPSLHAIPDPYPSKQ